MIDFEKELNIEQLKVVQESDGPCLVLAGAGSGKTRAITYRVVYLLEQGVDPKNILLMTFTNKAAREMVSRVEILSGGKIKMPWSGTFHHVGYRILRRYAPLLGFQNNFSILDSEDSVDMLKLCLKQEGIDRKERRFPSPKVIQSILSYARNAQTTIHEVLELQHSNWVDLEDILVRIANDYTARKKASNVMDFDDLLVYLHLLLLKSTKARDRYAEQFKYVLVDEYQDTNKLQASIVKLFASHHKNILVVGDDAQSIYSFRAADVKNILDFEKEYPQAKVFRLETNYRSTPDILNLANEVIANNVNQYQKNLKSTLENFTKPEVHAFADGAEEAEFIAERILELRDEGVNLNKIAVLFRAAFHSQALEMELTKRDIPYDYRGGIRFFERAHIKDVLSYLRIFNNKSDNIAWSRVLNMQVGIGPAGAQKITLALQHYNTLARLGIEEIRHLGAELPARGQIGWSDFLQIYSAMENVEDATPGDLIRAVLDSKYREYLENEYPDYRERLQDLEQLALFGERYEELDRFLAEASLQESYSAKQTRESSREEERLILSTVHQAKGLEWDAVFILNVSAGQFPNDRASRDAIGLEEERRLFYVAITRAKKYLYITYPLMDFGRSLLSGPSIFLEEVDRDLVDLNVSGDDSVFHDPSDDEDDITYETLEEDGQKDKRIFLKEINEL